MKGFSGVFSAVGQSQISLLKESADSPCKQLEINVLETEDGFCRAPNTGFLKEPL